MWLRLGASILVTAGLAVAALPALAQGVDTAPPAATGPDPARNPPPNVTPPGVGDYRLNPGDVLRISVWREDGLDRELIVQPDGTVSFPLAGQLAARGKTLSSLEVELAQRLERFIPGPVVTAELIEARGNVVYVIGEVTSPGAFQIARPTTVLQVLSQAGGFTPYAGRGRIRVVRKAEGGDYSIPFDYDDVTRGRATPSNIDLQAGDIVIVPGGSLF